ncbi:hypothetical protein CCB80_05105 [Armatimonadetes bacterium Uphvl-Ar1]|nr:hypothetical protein CCB80_05105 [Armatimonadetes bacterium Uphvl-Ar1]
MIKTSKEVLTHKFKISDFLIIQQNDRLIIRRRTTFLDVLSCIIGVMTLLSFSDQITKSLNFPNLLFLLLISVALLFFVHWRLEPIIFDLKSNSIHKNFTKLGQCDQVQIIITGDVISQTLTICGPDTEIWTVTTNVKSKVRKLGRLLESFLPAEIERLTNLAKFHNPEFEGFDEVDPEEEACKD